MVNNPLDTSMEEQSLIGAILVDEGRSDTSKKQDVWGSTREALTLECFSDPLCSDIFRSMVAIKEANPEDVLAFNNIHSHNNAIPVDELLNLQNIGIVATAPQNIREIHKAFIGRSLIEETSDARKLARQGYLAESIQGFTHDLERVKRLTSPPKNMVNHFDTVLADIIDEGSSIPTFSPDLNRLLNGGLRGGRTYTLTAPAGQGKSDFVLHMLDAITENSIKKAASENKPPDTLSILVSMEMGRPEILIRSLSRIGKVNSSFIDGQVWSYKEGEDDYSLSNDFRVELLKRLFSEGDIGQTYLQTIAPASYILHGNSGWNVQRIEREVKRIRLSYKDKNKLSELPKAVVCVDPFQMLTTGIKAIDSQHNRMIGTIAGQLKQMARNLGVPVILISDTTKAAAVNFEGKEGKASQGDTFGAYETTHRTNAQFTLQTGKDLPDRFAKYSNDNLGWVYDEGERVKEPGDCSTYACLTPTKNRDGTKKTSWYLYQKAFHTFTPLIKPTFKRTL